jgi:8-oxo-dGTP pyrophosphatase MutT (NUDIX family)
MAKARAKPARRDSRRQFAALPWRVGADGLEILMITSRETRRWVIPKGWPMKGKTPWQAAAQEAYEEAGIQGDIVDVPLGAYHYMKRYKKRPDVLCVVDVFPLQVGEELDYWPERDQRERVWMPAAAAAEAVDEPELTDLIQAFAALSG